MTTSIGWAAVQVVPVVPGVAGDISRQLQPQMQQAGQQAGQALGESIADGLAKAEAAVKTATRKLEQVRNTEATAAAKLNIEELKLQELRDKGNAKASQIAAAEDRVRQARIKNNEAIGAAEAALKQLETAQERVAKATQNAATESEESGRKLMSFSNSVDDMGSGVDNGIGKLTELAGVLAGIGGAVALGMQALDNLDVENTLAGQLGATGDLAAEYGDMAGNLYKQGLTGSMGEAADAVAAVASTFKVAGFEGERSVDQIAESALTFSKVFGTDVNDSVQTANQLITQGLAKDSTEAFDLMTTAWQRTGTGMRDELPDLMNEYGTFFSSLGFNGQESFGLLVNASEQGKIAMDKVGDALKETGIRATDIGDQAAQDALKGIGLNATDTANRLLAGGDVAKQAYSDMVDGLLKIQDPAKQAEAAIALFGTPLEDLNKEQIPAFLEAMSGAGESMSGFEGSSQQLADQINSGPGHALEQFKNTIQGGLTDALGDMAMWVQNNTDTLITLGTIAAPFFLALGGYAATVRVITIATTAWNAIQMILNGTMMLNPIGLIVAAIAGLVAAVVLIATKTTWFQDIWSVVWSAVTASWDWAWGVLSSGFELLKGAFGAVGDKVGEVKDWIVARFQDVVGFVTGLPGQIASAASGMWDGIKNAFRGAINWIIQAWNAIEFRIPGFEVGPVKWDGFVLGLPDLPMLASGGVAGRRKDGRLWGPGTGTSDSILGVGLDGIPTALVSTGEGVVKESAMGAGGADVVAALNAGWVPSAEFLRALVVDGDYRGGSALGIEEDSRLVAGALGVRSLAVDGDFTGNLRDSFGIEEDNPIVDAVLGFRDMLTRLPKYAEGGAVVSPDELVNFAKGVEGKPYVWGGVNWGDCSGAVSAVANFATGRAPFASRFATGNEASELAARGFLSGLGPAGSLQVGWFNGGPYGGHTAITLPNGVNFEMGGGRGNGQYGGSAAGANDPSFTDHAHLPMVVAQLIQPNVQKLDPLTGFPTDTPSAPGATTPLGMTATPSMPGGGGAAAPQQSFSARERFKQMGSDIGGIWADSFVEIFGLGDAFALADKFTITADQTSTAAMATPTSGQNGVDGDPNLIPWIKDLNSLLKGTGLFDTGGYLMPGQLAYNGLSQPEPVLKPEQWEIAGGAVEVAKDLVATGGGRGGTVINQTFHTTVADQAGFHRQANRDRDLAMMQFGGRPY